MKAMKSSQLKLALAFLSLSCLSASAETACKGNPASVPQVQHVFVVVEENQSYDDVVGNPDMPYLNQLAAHGGLARHYYANTHPSINNYFYLTSGQSGTGRPGVFADLFKGTVAGNNVASILTKHGKTWKSYAEDLPSVGYVGDNTGLYAKRHNPFTFYQSVVYDKAPAGKNQRDQIVSFQQFKTDWRSGVLPSYSFIIPNLINDAHNNPRTNRGSACRDPESLRQADHWLAENIKPVVESESFQRDSLLIIVFDEACDQGKKADLSSSPTRHIGGGGRIPVILAGAGIAADGCISDTVFHHESTLRLSLKALGINEFPGGAASAPDMGEFFGK
jgi:phosphatidylinositol-3-phosphatase